MLDDMEHSGFLATAALALACLAPAGPAAAAPACHGLAATVVGTPGATLEGTPGPDVILTGGATTTYADGGDDLICVTGPVAAAGVRVDAGGGDDRVAVETTETVRAFLGTGDDTYVGSDAADFVRAGGGTDHVFTLGGPDGVIAGGTPEDHQRDVVHLGAGDDQMRGGLDRTTQWYGDGGADEVLLPSDPPDATSGQQHDWRYSIPDGGSFRDGLLVQRYAGFETLTLAYPTARSVTLVGGPGDDTVHLTAAPDVARPIRIELGAGDDRVVDDIGPAQSAGAQSVRISAGPGRDRLVAVWDHPHPVAGLTTYLAVDLLHHLIRATRCDDDACRHPTVVPVGRVHGIEDVRAVAWQEVDLIGDTADNVLDAPNTCLGTFAGGSGDDLLVGGQAFGGGCHAASPGGIPAHTGAVFSGGGGDDTIIGTAGDDRIRGGPGHDSADGRARIDRCDAEVKRNCE